jgi:hypothetical protein
VQSRPHRGKGSSPSSHSIADTTVLSTTEENSSAATTSVGAKQVWISSTLFSHATSAMQKLFCGPIPAKAFGHSCSHSPDSIDLARTDDDGPSADFHLEMAAAFVVVVVVLTVAETA